VTDELPVHISREELHAMDVAPSFATEGSFDVVFLNHGQSVHVHLHLGDKLSEIASIDASNHYVEGESQRAVRVNVATDALGDEPLHGKLKVVSGYGAQTRWVDVTVEPTTTNEGSVEVDESLAEPQPREEPEETGGLLASPELPVLGLGALAVLIAVVATLLISDPLVLAGAVTVLLAVLVAVYLLIQ
jgi:hypothetical protein